MVLAAQRMQRIPDGDAFNLRMIVGPQKGHLETNQENSDSLSIRRPIRIREMSFIGAKQIHIQQEQQL
jgi:hypothetical protein